MSLMTSSPDPARCLVAAQLAASLFMKYVVVFKMIICFSGVILLLWHMKTVGTAWLVHPNAKLIYRVHMGFTLWVSVFFFAVHSLDLMRLSATHEDPCDYRVSIKLSLNLRLISVIGIYGQIVTMLCLAVERLVATAKPRSYEKVTSNTFAMVLVVLGTIFSFVFCYSMITPGVNWSSYNVGFVIKTSENKDRFQTLIWFEMVPEVISLCLFHVINLLNSPWRKRVAWVRDELDLASRYQIEENIKISTLLLPVFYTHFVIFFLTAFGIALFPVVLPNGGEDDFAIFLELTAWSPFYACAMPVIVSIKSYYRRRQLLQSSMRGRQSYFQPLTELAELSKDSRNKYALSNQTA